MKAPVISFRSFLESKAYCGLELSPLVGAIADAADATTPTSIDDVTCERHFGCRLSGLPTNRRRTIVVRAGGRGGKTSRLLAPKAIHSAWTAEFPTLRTKERGVSLIVAPDLKLAKQTLSFCVGYVEDSPILRAALVGAPTQDGFDLRRPDGKIVRVEVLAASRGGRAVRARTLAFAGMDEACFFFDEQSGAVNDADIFRAVAQRVVPGGQVWIVSTPWIAKTGLLETFIDKDWGVHKHTLCVTSGTRALNPTWDPTGEIERDMREQDPDAARREIDGEPISGTATSFFDWASLDAAVDDTLVLPRRPMPGEEVTAGGDFAFTSDSSAMVVVHRDHEKYRVGDILELRPLPDQPLKPSAVVSTIAARMSNHAGLTRIVADGHYKETIAEHLNANDLSLKLAPAGAEGVAEVYQKAKQLFREGKVAIPRNHRLLNQLRSIGWRANPGGSISIKKAHDRSGGHCDICDALVLALWESCGLVAPKPVYKPADPAYKKWARDMEEEAALAAFGHKDPGSGPEWWEGYNKEYTGSGTIFG
jgi:hypothetical protein